MTQVNGEQAVRSEPLEVEPSDRPRARQDARPDLAQAGHDKLRPMERAIVRFVRRTFEPGLVDRVIRRCQRLIGSTWIHHFTKHLRHVHGLERLPQLRADESVILVANHRSFFDLYVVVAELVRRGLPHRIVFPVRSNFFYTSPLGLFVNGVMSFFAMYPPIFRERHQLALNVTSLTELAWLIRRGGVLCGFHPEGMRNQGANPYELLPAHRGVGRVIYDTHATVIPVFINGLINDLPRQVRSNFDGTGTPIVVVFGEPVKFDDLLDGRANPRTYQAIADRALEAVAALGAEEREHRARLSAGTGSSAGR